jgi:chromosome partitioning protein
MTTKTLVANPKGGSGKSTACLNLTGVAVENGLKTLLIDFDPQGTSTTNSGVKDGSGFDIDAYCSSRILLERIKPSQLICRTKQGDDIIPSGSGLSLCDNFISSTPNGGSILQILFAQDKALEEYDLIIFDSQGANTQLLNAVALVCNDVLVPSIASKNNITGIQGVLDIIDSVNFFNAAMNKPALELRGHFFTAAQPRTEVFKIHNDSMAEILGAKHLKLFCIDDSTEVKKSEEMGMPLTQLSGDHKVTTQWRDLFKRAFKEFK